jgi:DNA-binding transcriptional MocR family regulator
MSKNYMRKNKIAGAFAPRRIEMLESPAYQVLSLSAHRALARLEIELAHHGGNDNGKLPVTKERFMEYGIHDHAIAPALRELEALGFIEITERGRAGNAEYRRPHKFRLTYRNLERANPTDEWTRIKSMEEAATLSSIARRTPTRKHFPVAENAECQGGNHHRKHKSPGAETTTTGQGAETTTTSISRTLSQEHGGRAGTGYALSTDLRAYEQFGTSAYRGPQFVVGV